jgi:hypothetical protein
VSVAVFEFVHQVVPGQHVRLYILCVLITLPLVHPFQFISDNFYWLILLAVPFLLAGRIYFLVCKMSEPEKMFQSLPGGLSPDKQRTLSGHQSWLNANELYPVANFQFGIIQVAAFQQRNTQRFFFFNFHQGRLTFCADTYFSDDTSLETSTSGQIGVLPHRPNKYVQSFPNLTPDEAWRRHLEAETYLVKKFGIKSKSLTMPYEQILFHNIRLNMQYVRSIPFYPFLVLYWYAVMRKRMANRSIEEQFP